MIRLKVSGKVRVFETSNSLIFVQLCLQKMYQDILNKYILTQLSLSKINLSDDSKDFGFIKASCKATLNK